MCQKSSAYISGIQQTDKTFRFFDKVQLPCNSFSCPECAPYKTKELRARIFNGELLKSHDRNSKYSAKFFTFTVPGKEYRSWHSPQVALKDVQKSFNKLMTCIRKKFGKVAYLRVTEPQKDGYPHLHVVFISTAIASQGFLNYVESLWRYRYGMGFVKGNVIYNLEHAIRYVTKYLTKSLKPIKKYQRIFSSSKGALMKKEKKEKKWVGFRNIAIGYCDSAGQIHEADITDFEEAGLIEAIEKMQNYAELEEFINTIKQQSKK